MKIKCSKCGQEQKPSEYFLRFMPIGVTRPIYICPKCENELGGKDAALAWVIDVFVTHANNPRE